MSGSSSIGDSSHGYAGIPGEEEMAEQGQSPDSQPPGHTAGTSSLPSLAIPPRLMTLDDEGIKDPYSPATPSEEVMSWYADPDNLPGPSHHYPEAGITAFGSVLVGDKDAHHYLAVRQHMAKAREGQKILAVVEQRDIDTRVLPYSAGAYSQAVTVLDDEKNSVGVYFPVDQGIFMHNGGRLSAATIAAHELAHAARAFRNPQTREVEYPPHVPHGGEIKHWTKTEERLVIEKIERPVADANGEPGKNDSHMSVGFFFTRGLRSTTPVDPQEKRTIEEFGPRLRRLTEQMDQHGTRPEDIHELVPAMRHNIAVMAVAHLNPKGLKSAAETYISDGKSLDEMATELVLTNDQKEFVRNMFPPPEQS